MEIEAKFRVAGDATFQDVLALPQIGPFALRPEAEPELQHNTYFDTADMRLRAGRYGLRIRDLGTRRIATLKGATSVHDGVYERDEYEAAIGDDDRPVSWPAGELRDRVLALLGGAPVQPILSMRTTRRHVYAFRGAQRVAEISLDDGLIHAGGRQESLRELEIELVAGAARADFDALVGLLRERFALVPEDRSKLARGMALLDAAGVPSAEH